MNDIEKEEKEFKKFLWENNIIKWGYFIELDPTGSSKEILGLGIRFSIFNKKLIIHKNNKKNYSSVFLTIISWNSEIIKIEEESLKEKENWENMINLFKKINNINYFEKHIELDEETILYIKHCTPYLISPLKPDYYYLENK